MESARLTIGREDLLTRIRQRLMGVNNTGRLVVWHSGSNRVLINGGTLQARLLRGWLLVSVDLQTDQTGRATLEFVYFLGAPGEADGNSAASKINAATRQASQLAEIFGDDLQRVIWDAVLDAIEAAIRAVANKYRNQPLTLRGFQADPEGLLVDVLAGEL